MSPKQYTSHEAAAPPWIWMELNTNPDKLSHDPILVLARVNQLNTPNYFYGATDEIRVDGFTFDFVDDGHDHCAFCIGTVRRGRMSWKNLAITPSASHTDGANQMDRPGLRNHSRIASSFGPRCKGVGFVISLTLTSWELTKNALSIAGVEGAPFIEWIGQLLREKRLGPIVLDYLAFPGLHSSMDVCVSEWRHKRVAVSKSDANEKSKQRAEIKSDE